MILDSQEARLLVGVVTKICKTVIIGDSFFLPGGGKV